MIQETISLKNRSIDHSTSTNKTLFNLSDFNKKQVEVSFVNEQISHDGGLLLLNEVDKQIDLISSLSSCINDTRHQGYVQHSVDAMLRQRIMQIAAGYEDANDCDFLKDDEILKLCAGKENSLASQPTMCRLENSVSFKELYQIAKVFVDNFIQSYDKPPESIILDCDDTNATTYGKQQFSLFNNYYRDYCYMPLHIYEGLSGKLITTILKPGRRSKTVDMFSILKRIITHIQEYWPKTVIILRGDSHFCSKEFMDWSQEIKTIHFITGLSGNSKLNELTKYTIESAKREYESYKKPVKRYHSFYYKAGTWKNAQRVVVKVEANSMGVNVRFIVSSLVTMRAKILYENAYCARGTAELRIKDHKTFLLSDKMSCSEFKANQFRLFLHSAAYVLIHTLQKKMLSGTKYYAATMKTIQLKFIKVAAKVKVLKTKVKIELPTEFITKHMFINCFEKFKVLRE